MPYRAGGVAACGMGLIVADLHWPWWAAILVAIASGALIGLVIGVLRAKLGIPSFVVTLAFFLGLQGVTLKLIGEGGSVRVDDPVIRGLTISNVPVAIGWTVAVLVVLGIREDSALYFDAALLIALTGFVATVALERQAAGDDVIG